MWIVAIAWMYVALMMAIAEATASNGTVLGAIITLLLYGIAPTSLVMYLLTTPARRRARRAAEARALAARLEEDEAMAADAEPVPLETDDAPSAPQPDHGGLPASDAIAPKRIEP